MKLKTFFFALIALLAGATAYGQPLLNGLAMEQQFNKDRYIAAVYSDEISADAGALLNDSLSRRIEIRVIANNLSARRLRNQWMEAIAINNSNSALTEEANNMVAFANLFKGRLYTGDSLTIDFDGNSGVSTVLLNNNELGKIESRTFFSILLRSWIGPVPPSTEFRDGLLASGDVDQTLLGRFEGLTPTQDRIAAVAATVATAAPAAAAAVQAAPKPAPAKPKLAAAIPPPSLATLQPAPVETTAPAAQPQTEAAPVESAPAQPAPEPVQVAAVVQQPALEDELEEEEDEPLTASLLLAQQVYHSMLLRHTYKYLSYPQRAQARGQEGSIRLSVVIDKQGRVSDVTTVQESRYSSLNKAALKAIREASPYPRAPSQLAKDNYRFSVPITFRLP